MLVIEAIPIAYLPLLISSILSTGFAGSPNEAKKVAPEREDSPHEPRRTLTAVGQAVDIALTPSGWHGLEWDFAEDTIVAHHDEFGRLPVDTLSDGIRNMIGLVADIAHRSARLNPHLGESAAIGTPGIVLIDEVDMHLHPQWQQVVLQSLEKAFPLIQFIVTTHSPQVLTTVRKENIRIFLRDEHGMWTAGEPATSPLAHESGDALALIMGTHPRPDAPAILPDLHAYEQLARAGQGNSEEAREIQARLDAAVHRAHDNREAPHRLIGQIRPKIARQLPW